MNQRRTLIALAALAMAAALAPPATAQLGLPLPAVPGVGDVAGRLPRVETPDLRKLTDLRRLKLKDLIARNRDVIDVDEAGAPVVRGEVLALSPSPQALEKARKAGFTVARQERLEGLGLTLVTLTPPPGLSARKAVKRLRKADPDTDYDFNHIYSDAGSPGLPAAPAAPGGSGGRVGVRVGLIDSGVDAGHPALSGVAVEQRGFAPGGVRPHPHGTAVASLIAGQAAPFRGAAPGAALLVADVYGTGPTGGAADYIIRALNWMAQSRVPVVNVSLVGPSNGSVRATIKAMAAQGTLVVAAVGNDGPAAPPLYPASYPEAVAVTGVDGRGRVLLEASRASHLDFAAPGADMAAAVPGGGFTSVRGTSFAAPIVAGRLAALMDGRSPAAARAAVEALGREARDLGPKGPDKTYGRGLVGEDLRVAPQALAGR